MKKIIIGRNNACDIIIPDTTDLVSRKQAVLAIDFWGKMILFDTSNNGTFVNGQRIENGEGMRVTRKDKVTFAQVAELDWNQVEDPYRKARILAPIAALLFAALVGGVVWWFLQRADDKETATPAPTEVTAPKGETISTLDTPSVPAPATPKTQVKPSQKTKHKPQAKKSNPGGKKDKDEPTNGKEVLEKNVDDKTPIVY